MLGKTPEESAIFRMPLRTREALGCEMLVGNLEVLVSITRQRIFCQ